MSLLASETLGEVTLGGSHDFCRQLTRSQAKNFYYGLKLLPEPKRSAMFTLYAYMRLVDDIADDQDGRSVRQRVDELENWREQTHLILSGREASGNHLLWPAFGEMIRMYRMPPKIFDDVIAGQRQDLEPEPFETFAQLKEYCYRVAGVVGLASIYIWGFEGGAETEALAVDRGVAFQLTNILRDLKEDADNGRTYIPREDLATVKLSEDELRSSNGGEAFEKLMQFQIERAESYYRISSPLEDRIQKDCRPTLIAMTQIYHGLLKKMAAEPARVLRQRVSLSLVRKLIIGWQAVRSR
jgi:15-cis-phytoene synthase